jgi:hypothetical protein
MTTENANLTVMEGIGMQWTNAQVRKMPGPWDLGLLSSV